LQPQLTHVCLAVAALSLWTCNHVSGLWAMHKLKFHHIAFIQTLASLSYQRCGWTKTSGSSLRLIKAYPDISKRFDFSNHPIFFPINACLRNR